jgi:hypothetical protein
VISWPVYVVVGISGVALWRSEARALRFAAVVINLAVLDHYCVFLANVGRNTFEHVERREPTADIFREGVFAEAKAADAFAREQLLAVYIVAICLGGLAIWPAVAKRGVRAHAVSGTLEGNDDVQAPPK